MPANMATWTAYDAAAPLGENIWNAIAYGDGVFVAVSSAFGYWDRAMRSTDNGQTWQLQPSSRQFRRDGSGCLE